MTEEVFALDTVPAGARLHKVSAQPVAYHGRAALRVELAPSTVAAQDYVDSNTFVVVPVDFGDGEIEVDLLGKLQGTAPPFARGFIGVAFRVAPDCSTFEAVYLRPTNGRAEDPERRQHAVQYFAYPHWKFDRLRQEAPGRYEAAADIGPDEWLRMRLAVEGKQVRMYLDGLGAGAPTLTVEDLKLGPAASGAVGLWVDIGTEGCFANLRIVHRGPRATAARPLIASPTREGETTANRRSGGRGESPAPAR